MLLPRSKTFWLDRNFTPMTVQQICVWLCYVSGWSHISVFETCLAPVSEWLILSGMGYWSCRRSNAKTFHWTGKQRVRYCSLIMKVIKLSAKRSPDCQRCYTVTMNISKWCYNSGTGAGQLLTIAGSPSFCMEVQLLLFYHWVCAHNTNEVANMTMSPRDHESNLVSCHW